MNDEFLKIILLLSVGQGITLSLMLWFKRKGENYTNKILAVFLFLIIVPLWNEYVSFLPQSYHFLIFHPNTFYLQLLYGPLLYLYVVKFTKAAKLSPSIWALLALGPIIGALFKITHFYILDGGIPAQIWHYFFFFVNIQIAIFLAMSWLLIDKHHKDIKENLSNLDKVKVNWLTLLILGYSILLSIDFVRTTAKIMGVDILESMRLAVSISECIFIFLVGYWGINKQEIHFDQVLVKAKNKYENSGLKQTAAQELINNLDSFMQKEQAYLDNEISLSTLSKELNVTPHHISQAINEQLGLNFYDFINSARVEHAKKMLTDVGFYHLPIIDIAYQVGFNNKTSFNNAFKKFTQTTPSQFRKNTQTTPQ